MNKYWMVYPTKRVKGFTVTYMPCDGSMKRMIAAADEAIRMQRASGVMWEIKLVER